MWRWRWRWRWPFTEVGRQIGQANGSDGSDEEEYGKKRKKKKKVKTGKAAVLETKQLALEQRMYYNQPSTATTSLRRRGGGGGVSSGSGSGGSGVENGNGWLFDVWLREENGQQLERTTLEMVLSDELLAFPLGIFLRDLDVTASSGTCTPLLLLASSTMDSAPPPFASARIWHSGLLRLVVQTLVLNRSIHQEALHLTSVVAVICTRLGMLLCPVCCQA